MTILDGTNDKKVNLIVAFKGGQFAKCDTFRLFANDTMQQWRKFLKSKFAMSKEEALAIGPVYYVYFIKNANPLEELQKKIAEDPTYDENIEWIIDFTEVCGMYIIDEPKCDHQQTEIQKSFGEYLDLTKQWLKSELKPDSWKGGE